MKIYFRDNFCTIYKLQLNFLVTYLTDKGVDIVYNPAQADIIILGLCAAFEADEARSIKIIEENMCFALGGGKKIIVYGCFSKVREDILKKYHEIKYVYLWEIDKILNELCINNDDFYPYESMWPSNFRLKEDYRVYDKKKKFIGISTGCSFDCVYCPHKLGSGNLKSRKLDSILEQINQLKNEDVEKIILTGTDTAAYGKDLGIEFADLLEAIMAELDKMQKNIKIRIAQFNPEGLNDKYETLLKLCKDNRVEEFQMPIQTSSNRLLNIMNRKYTKNQVSEFIEELRKDNENIFLRTDLLVGFPTETMDELLESVEFANKYFDEVAIYKFEFKKGTAMEKCKFDYLSEEEKERRKRNVYEILGNTKCLHHSGGQDMDSLISSDFQKEGGMKNG
jgi:MiaB/RimO family radical SAM methylthiotransferase